MCDLPVEMVVFWKPPLPLLVAKIANTSMTRSGVTWLVPLVLSGFSLHRSCECCHNCSEFICVAALPSPDNTVSLFHLLPLDVYTFFLPLGHNDLLALGGMAAVCSYLLNQTEGTLAKTPLQFTKRLFHNKSLI